MIRSTLRLGRAVSIGQYPAPDPIHVTARAMGMTWATARQLLNPTDERSPFTRAATIIAALVTAGLFRQAERLVEPIDRARRPAPLFVTPEDFATALEYEQRADGFEDCAELWVRDAASYDTWRRRAIEHVVRTQAAIRIGDAYFRRGEA